MSLRKNRGHKERTARNKIGSIIDSAIDDETFFRAAHMAAVKKHSAPTRR